MGRDRKPTSVGLRIPRYLGLFRRLELPLAAKDDIRRILTHQIDRITPYKAEDICFDFRVLEENRKAGSISVELVAVPGEVVRDALALLQTWRFEAEFVDLDGLQDVPLGTFNLLPVRPASGVRRSAMRLSYGLGLVNVALVIAILGLPLLAQAEREVRLRQELETVKLKSEAVVRLRSKLEELEATARLLSGGPAEQPSAIVVLDELTRVLPDGSWLEQLTLRSAEVQLRGYSANASAVIALLEGSEAFENAEFRAPVTRLKAPPVERFNISAQILRVSE